MTSNRNEKIANRFGEHANRYDAHADLQASVANRLAGFLPNLIKPNILELGCGTGLFTGHLVEKYPEANLYVTDLSEDMLAMCRNRYIKFPNVNFSCQDGEKVCPDGTIPEQLDIIALSMALQWFRDPVSALLRLKTLLSERGQLYYATLGTDCFPEWHHVLQTLGLPAGTIEMPELPGKFHEEKIPVQYNDSLDFLRTIKAIGAATPRLGYRPISSAQMRRVLQSLNHTKPVSITWHITFGRINALGV